MNATRMAIGLALFGLLFAGGLAVYFLTLQEQAALPPPALVVPITASSEQAEGGLSEAEAIGQLQAAAAKLRELGYSSSDLDQLVGSPDGNSSEEADAESKTSNLWLMGIVFILIIAVLGITIGIRAVRR